MIVHICRLVIPLLLISEAYAHSGNHQDTSTEPPQVLAPGYQELQYDPPAPGSYSLPVLTQAVGGNVIDDQGQMLQLDRLFGDKIVALSFIYTHCDDVNGCPLATYVFSIVQGRIAAADDLRDRVKLISLSFDPANDTPEQMEEYGRNFIEDGFDWQFLTTRSDKDLAPILAAYNQSIKMDVDDDGKPLGTISHILRVFLIDKNNQIRNIYSMSFLHPDTMINDIRTLLLEESESGSVLKTGTNRAGRSLHGAGDRKDGYEDPGYHTSASSLAARTGSPSDLFRYIYKPPLGLPRIKTPADNSLTATKIELGRKLFYDRRLSLNNTISCAMCHVPEQGFTSNEIATAVGIEGRTVRRNTPTLYNVAYAQRLFHDARESTLEQQVWGPLLARNEMGNPSVGTVIDKITSLDEYEGAFEQVFHRGPSMETIGMAIASYERTLVSGNSRFDRWYFLKQTDAVSPAAVRGYKLFTGKAQCSLCHIINSSHALFTDNKLHNTGIGYLNSSASVPQVRRVLVAPGTYIDVETSAIKDSSEPRPGDLGQYEITGNPDDRWKYKTPTLRNVELTAPYMHDGSLSSLTDVVRFYNKGGIRNELLDPLIRPLDLSEVEIQDLVTFLVTLTGDNVDEIITDAFAAPIGNVTASADE